MSYRTLVAACAFAAGLGGAQMAAASTVFDESVDGDGFGSIGQATDVGALAANATSTIFGAYDAAGPGRIPEGPDEQDSFAFMAPAAFTIDAATLSGDDASYSLWVLPPSSRAFSGPGTDIFGSFMAGTYVVSLVGSGNAGAGEYRIDINVGSPAVIPLGPTAPLLLSALGALGVALRKRRRAA